MDYELCCRDFGESGLQEKHHFTSYERDTESSLDYAMNRFYSSLVGKFSSSDPALRSAVPADPQTWNRYSYSNDDPINLSDPTGLMCRMIPNIRKWQKNKSLQLMCKTPGIPLTTGPLGLKPQRVLANLAIGTSTSSRSKYLIDAGVSYDLYSWRAIQDLTATGVEKYQFDNDHSVDKKPVHDSMEEIIEQAFMEIIQPLNSPQVHVYWTDAPGMQLTINNRKGVEIEHATKINFTYHFHFAYQYSTTGKNGPWTEGCGADATMVFKFNAGGSPSITMN